MTANRKITRSAGPRHTLRWVLVLSLFIVELLFYTWCRVQCVQVGIATGQENQKIHELEKLQNNLEIELARLKAPERISHIAHNQLALDLPEPRQVIVLP
jgi:cell division protein FtsL